MKTKTKIKYNLIERKYKARLAAALKSGKFLYIVSIISSVTLAILLFTIQQHQSDSNNPNTLQISKYLIVQIKIATLILSGVLYLVYDHDTIAESLQVSIHFPIFIRYFGLAVLYVNTTINHLVVIKSSNTGFTNACRLLITVIIWCYAFKRQLQWFQWDGIFLLAIGLSMKSILRLWENTGYLTNYNLPFGGDLEGYANRAEQQQQGIDGFIGVLCNTLVCVYREHLLKRYGTVASINLQQIFLLSSSIFILTVYSFFNGYNNRPTMPHTVDTLNKSCNVI